MVKSNFEHAEMQEGNLGLCQRSLTRKKIVALLERTSHKQSKRSAVLKDPEELSISVLEVRTLVARPRLCFHYGPPVSQ